MIHRIFNSYSLFYQRKKEEEEKRKEEEERVRAQIICIFGTKSDVMFCLSRCRYYLFSDGDFATAQS